MKEKIVSYLKDIEHKHGVRVLFAIESGSRLWRIASKDSDYDVRFVFVGPIERYLSLDSLKVQERVINEMYDERLVDMSGFDIFKFCRLLAKSNPSMIEWLQSNIVYYGKKPEELVTMGLQEFDPTALYYHYTSMCKKNFEKYIQNGETRTYKKYLYAMRGLINALYVAHTGKLPEIEFNSQLGLCKGLVSKEIIDELRRIIEVKSRGEEKQIVRAHKMFDTFIEEFLEKDFESVIKREMDYEKLDKVLRTLVRV